MSQNMKDLLDGNIADLSDKPEFKPFPVGTHRCKFSWEEKKIDKVGSGIQLNLTAIKTEELPSDSKESPVEPGAKTSVMMFLSHDTEFVWQFGQGQFKELMATLAEKFGAASPRELMKKSDGMEGLFLTGVRENKDKTQRFTSVEGFALL